MKLISKLLAFANATIGQIHDDKLKHYFGGTLLGALIMLKPIIPIPHLEVYILFLGMLSAIGKEAYDYFSGKGTPEVADAMYTFSGTLIVVLPTIILS